MGLFFRNFFFYCDLGGKRFIAHGFEKNYTAKWNIAPS